METQVETKAEPTKAAAPAPTTKVKPKPRFLLHAVIVPKDAPGSGSTETNTVKITAEKRRELFAEIAKYPDCKVVTIIKGRELQFKETRQLSLI